MEQKWNTKEKHLTSLAHSITTKKKHKIFKNLDINTIRICLNFNFK